MKLRILIAILTFIPLSGIADEVVKGTNYYVLDNQAWPIGEKSGYYHFNGAGISSIELGPTKTGAVECHGSGFWGPKGNRSEGLCVHGSGDDTFTSTYRLEEGAEKGQWTILSGTGRYARISGSGTYKSEQFPGDRAVSHWEGKISLGQ